MRKKDMDTSMNVRKKKTNNRWLTTELHTPLVRSPVVSDSLPNYIRFSQPCDNSVNNNRRHETNNRKEKKKKK